MKHTNFATLSSPLFFPSKQSGNVVAADPNLHREILEVEIQMQQTELSKQFQAVVQASEKRIALINYVMAVLLVFTLGWALLDAWRTTVQEKIESIRLIPDSVQVIGPTALCPGDTLTIRYSLEIDGTGVVITDDSVKLADRTVKFSDARREIIDQAETRVYEDSWKIPPRPAMAINGESRWLEGSYVRYISVAASNNYVSRYTDPVRFQTNFRIREDCF